MRDSYRWERAPSTPRRLRGRAPSAAPMALALPRDHRAVHPALDARVPAANAAFAVAQRVLAEEG